MFISRCTPRRTSLLAGLLSSALLTVSQAHAQTAPTTYSQFIVFGDSLSDTGNFAAAAEDKFDVRYPSNQFNYADGRFTDGGGSDPSAVNYQGVWHEQLARFFLGMTPASNSLDGGTDYAYGDAETLTGTRTVEITTVPGAGLSLEVPNLNNQVTTYLADHTTDPAALYIVWAGANDLFENDGVDNAAAAAQRETAVVQRLAEAGAKTLLVPNLPPLGLTPAYSGDATMSQALTFSAGYFRDQLNADLDTLEAALAAEGLTVKIYRLDIYDLFNRLSDSAGLNYGFTNITQSSQDSELNPDKSLFWDDVHPTTYGHFQIAAEAYSVLTGIPVVEISPMVKTIDRNGGAGSFLITRTGPDLSQTLSVAYDARGTAVEGTEYAMLKGFKKLKPGQRTKKVNIVATGVSTGSDSTKVKLFLLPGADYVLPVVTKSTINIKVGGFMGDATE